MKRLTFEEYAAIDGVNWSNLKNLAVSPLLYQWRLAHPEPYKPAFALGSAIHCAILEPETFDDRYAVYEAIRNGKVWEAWKLEHPGVESLKPAEMAHVRMIAKAVREHRVAGELLRGGRREEALTWTEEATGLVCKGRLDYIRPDFIIDLKSTRDPSPRSFERASAGYGYAGQVAFYHDGAVQKRLIDGRMQPYIIAPQSKDPYDVVVFQLEPETLDGGRALYRSLLQRLIECTEANYWPGMAPEVQPLRLPAWAQVQINPDSEEF